MSDPRNVAHNKKVTQGKQHHQPITAGKSKKAKRQTASGADDNTKTAAGEAAKPEHAPGELEKSLAVLSKLKEMQFHARANIETLASLTLEIEDELKQKEFSEGIGTVYSAQDGFQSKIGMLIEAYEAKCESLKPTA